MDDIQETLNDRELTHGRFADNSATSQGLKTCLRASPNWNWLAPTQREALDAICSKIGRITGGNPDYLDHWHDIAGYAMLVGVEIGRKERMEKDRDIDRPRATVAP